MNDPITTYGLIGNPVKHSLSPVMHNTAFQALEVDAVYELFPLQEDELDQFFKDLKSTESQIFGLNVTVPYKEKVIKYLDSLSPFADKIQAVNTIVIDEHRNLIGHNTDGPGFLAHLTELKVELENLRIVLLGAGGAARAIIAAICLLPDRPENIKIYDIDFFKAKQLVDSLKEKINMDIVQAVSSIDDLEIPSCDVLINTTPVGMKKDDVLLFEPELLHQQHFVYDLIYNPAETLLLKTAKSRGAKTANGLGMLFYQGVLAFQHWANEEIPEEVKLMMRLQLEEAAGIHKS